MTDAAPILAALRGRTVEAVAAESPADELAALLAVRSARRRSRPAARPRYPREVERAYTRALEAYAASVAREVRRTLGPILARAIKAEAAEASRRDATPLAEILAVIGALRLRLTAPTSAVARIVDRHGDRMIAASAADAARVLRISPEDNPAAVRAWLEAWRRENVNLITSIPANLLDEVLTLVTEAADRGTRNEVLAKQIEKRFGVSRSRARLIARDQIGKANGQLTEIRHREAGVTRYRWSTSQDERVRPDHRRLNGKIFDWTDPPVVNKKGERRHPGGDIQCRCVAVPILDLD